MDISPGDFAPQEIETHNRHVSWVSEEQRNPGRYPCPSRLVIYSKSGLLKIKAFQGGKVVLRCFCPADHSAAAVLLKQDLGAP